MTITIGAWIGFLIGVSIGGMAGMIIAAVLSDRYWDRKYKNVLRIVRKYELNVPYEIEKENKPDE